MTKVLIALLKKGGVENDLLCYDTKALYKNYLQLKHERKTSLHVKFYLLLHVGRIDKDL